MATSKKSIKLGAQTQAPPKLSSQEWNAVSIVGIVFLVMAVLQLISFSDFQNWLEHIGLASSTAWAVGLILAELLASVTFFKVPLSSLMRTVSQIAAVVVGSFWFVQNIKLLTDNSIVTDNSGFFGKFLPQTPGWWTIIEATFFLFVVIYCVDLLRKKA